MIVTSIYLLEWLLFIVFHIDTLEYIPNTSIRLQGLRLTIIAITILIFLSKELMQIDKSATVLNITLQSLFIFLISELLFQPIRQLVMPNITFHQRVYIMFDGVIRGAIMAGLLAFFIALQLKTRRLGMTIVLVLITSIILGYINRLLSL